MLLVEHDVWLVMSMCDRIVALDFGRVIAVGHARRDPRRRGRGRRLSRRARRGPPTTSPGATPAAGWTGTRRTACRSEERGRRPDAPCSRRATSPPGTAAWPRSARLDLHVDAGEVVALLGPNGAGQDHDAQDARRRALAARRARSSGRAGHPARPLHRRARMGLAYVPEERSVFMGLTAAENLRVGDGPPRRRSSCSPSCGPHLKRKAGLLSGGQQQMLTLARALASGPAAPPRRRAVAGPRAARSSAGSCSGRARRPGVASACSSSSSTRGRPSRWPIASTCCSGAGSRSLGPSAEILDRLDEVEQTYLSAPRSTTTTDATTGSVIEPTDRAPYDVDAVVDVAVRVFLERGLRRRVDGRHRPRGGARQVEPLPPRRGQGGAARAGDRPGARRAVRRARRAGSAARVAPSTACAPSSGARSRS